MQNKNTKERISDRQTTPVLSVSLSLMLWSSCHRCKYIWILCPLIILALFKRQITNRRNENTARFSWLYTDGNRGSWTDFLSSVHELMSTGEKKTKRRDIDARYPSPVLTTSFYGASPGQSIVLFSYHTRCALINASFSGLSNFFSFFFLLHVLKLTESRSSGQLMLVSVMKIKDFDP